MIKWGKIMSLTVSQRIPYFKQSNESNIRGLWQLQCNSFARKLGKQSSLTEKTESKASEKAQSRIPKKFLSRSGSKKDNVSELDENVSLSDLEENTPTEVKALFQKIEKRENEKELDQEIVKMMREGRSDEEILSGLLGNPIKPKKSAEEKVPKKTLDNLLDDFLELESNNQKNNKIYGSPLPQVNEVDRSTIQDIKSMREQMDFVTKLSKESPEKLISEAPLGSKQHKKLKKQKLEDKETEAFERIYSEDKNQMLKKQKKREEMTPEERTSRVKLENIKRATLTAEEIELVSAQDKEFDVMSKADLQESAKEMDIFVVEPKPGDSRLPRIKEDLEVPDIRTKAKNELARLIDMGIEPEAAKTMVKESIFQMKKLEEERIQAKKRMEKKQKQKKLRALMEETHQLDEIDEEMDYNDPTPKESKKKSSIEMLATPEGWDELIAEYEKEEEIEEETRPTQFELFKGGTRANIESYLIKYFQKPKASTQRLTHGREIEIQEVAVNDAITVVNVFWAIRDEKNISSFLKKDSDVIKKIQRNLTKFAAYLRGKMCRDMGFKYAHDLRFYYSDLDVKSEDIRENFTRVLPDLYKNRLEEDLKKGITHKDPRARFETLSENIEDQIEHFAKKYSHYEELLRSKKDERIKRKREHRQEVKNHHDRKLYKQSKKEKQSQKTDRFWQSLKT